MSVVAAPVLGQAGARRAAMALGAAVAVTLPHAAFAQGSPQPPSRSELEAVTPTPTVDRRSRLSVEGDIERGPCPLADPSFANTMVTFGSVEFTGLPGVPADVLADTWREYAGRAVPVVTLCEIRDRAATQLRAMGFLAAVQVPAQRIENGGTVKLDVLAARLVEVQLRGDPGPSEKLIEAMLARLTAHEWFNTREAERQLLLLQDLPGYNVRLVLRSADGAPGEVIGDIELERTPIEVTLGGQNLAPPSTGREGAFVALTVNDVFGAGDTTTLSYYNTLDWKEQHLFRATNELALGSNGLRLLSSFTAAHSLPDVVGGMFVSDTLGGSIALRYPLVRRQALSLFASAGLDIVDQELKFGRVLLSKDELRIANVRIDYIGMDEGSVRGRGGFDLIAPRWRALASLQLRQGIDGLGASKACVPISNCTAPNYAISNLNADPSSFAARLDGTFEFRPVRKVTLAISPLAQWSDGPLLSYEQVSLGNYTVGRGFEPGTSVGDRAIGASFELRYGTTVPGQRSPWAIEPFVFLDLAKGWIDDPVGGLDPDELFSAGGGVRGRWGPWADFSVIFAVPLQPGGYQTETPDPRVLINFTTHLWPWRKM